MAYPWIFLVADDWGRFEFDPQRIWSKVFGGRRDVTEAEVEAWMAEYEREGLLERYHIDGELAHWTKFEGRPPSKRRPSHYPDPQQLKGKRRSVPKRKAVGTGSVPGVVPDGYPLAEIEQSSSRSGEQSGETAARSDVEVILAYWIERTNYSLESDTVRETITKRLQTRLKEGFTVEQLKRCVDVALWDPFYVEKGYHKQPDVIWRNAERVNKLLTKAQHEGGRPLPL